MVVAHEGKNIRVLYIVDFETSPKVDPVDVVGKETERRHLGIGT